MKHGMLDGEQCDKMSMMGKHLALRSIKNTECYSMVCDFDKGSLQSIGILEGEW